MLNRIPTALVVAVLAMTTFATGCILVVEEDDYGRDRGHSLYGTSWILAFVIHGGRHHYTDHGYGGLRFSSETAVGGTLACASFSASYDESGGSIEVERVRASTFNCDHTDETTRLILELLPDGSSLEVVDDALHIRSRTGGSLVFDRDDR